MRSNPRTLAAVAVLFVALAVGCQATPRERYATAERALAATADGVKAVVDARVVDNKPDLLKAMRAGLLQANAALAKAKPYALAGNDPDTRFWTDRVLAVIATVADQIAQAKAVKP